MIAVTVISCFSSFIVGLGVGFVFVVERAGNRMFEDSVD